jgi:signal transduction histidine kinase
MEAVNEALETQVAARTNELQETLNALQLAHERLVRGEKMNLLGELMSGIAHEIRSPLSSLLSGCHLLAGRSRDKKVVETTALMKEATERLAAIVDNMLMFARNQPPARATVELNKICERAIDLISSDLRNDRIELRQDYAPSVPRLELDVQQVQQVLLNLLNNARQALEHWEGERWIRLSTRANHEAVWVDVEDSGPGIPAADRASVFQPFFTTKKTGTGLGLSLCRRFLEAHGARLDLLESTAGALFRLTFPRSACETMVAMPQPE